MLLLAFLANLIKLQKQSALIYLLMNFTGAALACYASYLIDFLPFIILEGTWALVAAVAMVKKEMGKS
ncbi:MAG: hypothetical protein JST18_00115 [Bacteroidetes bacterium]|nr:hypothetical protein [Bacteroidota bacterium]